jgi:hypothetical protein
MPVSTAFKSDLLSGVHDFDSGSSVDYKLALFTAAAAIGASYATYTTTNESSGTGYTAGGFALTKNGVTSGATSFTDFADLAPSGLTITDYRYVVIYETTTNKVCFYKDLGSTRSVSSGTITITFPTADTTNAILRVA